jgi:hypothetical protein
MLRTRKFSALAAVVAACAIGAGASSAQAAWSVASGTPPSTAAQFTGVSCVTTTFCLFVGPQSSGTTSGYAQKWTGTFSTPTPATTTDEFDGVGCNSTTLCFAAGSDTSTLAAHMESFNGSTFSNSTTANPSGSTFTQLSGTACPGSTSCFSVGQYSTATSTSTPVVEHWTGTSWGTMTLTLPSGTTTAGLSDISCTSTTACTATGWYATASITRAAMILRYNGTSWAPQTGATISGATQAELDGVSCTSATSCNAVGYYLDASSVQHELAETWSTSWTQKTIPAITGAADGALSDISCYTSTSSGCIAVGGYTDASANVQPEVAGYNGTSYTQQTISRPSGTTDTTLNGVSCTSSSFCMIAGTAAYTSTGIGPVAYRGP